MSGSLLLTASAHCLPGSAVSSPLSTPRRRAAVHDAPILPSRVYIAPAGQRHMLIDRGKVRLEAGPRENRHRPSIDPLFRSASYVYGAQVIGVVLSGNLDDGSAGLAAIKEGGGIAMVQDPDDALWPSMPLSAMESTWTSFCPKAD